MERNVRIRFLEARWNYHIILVALAMVSFQAAHAQEPLYSVSLKGNYTISSRLFYNIEASDEFLRRQYLAIDNIFGVGVDVRRLIEETWLQVGISVEYLRKKETGVIRISSARVPVEDGFWTVPVEMSGYFIIPFSSATFRLYIGGGGGLYFGERRYAIAEERASIVDTKKGMGIHVVTGVEYAITEWFAIRSEVKFRDLQFESTHLFTKSSVSYNGTIVTLDQTPSRSRINVDGMLIDAGIVLRF